MYPEVFVKFARAQQAWGDVEVLPSPQFFFGMQKGEEITVDIEAGKRLVIKFLTRRRAASGRPPHGVLRAERPAARSDGARPLAQSQRRRTAEGDPNNPGHVGAPLPGMITTVAVELNQTVEKGDRLLVIEAMKMQSTIYAPVAGKVTAIHAQAGQQVEAKDLLVVIE